MQHDLQGCGHIILGQVEEEGIDQLFGRVLPALSHGDRHDLRAVPAMVDHQLQDPVGGKVV